ncbi:SRPBCC domain-containing protein [Pseudorhodoplanes sp.]|uniref:SRPBCC family protein n=1 Tax=Pseudorhodoplanes sp. TaxID=1934341 RepID=UPI003919FA8F
MTLTDTEQDFVVTRIVKAPRARVWEAYSQADQLARWWGPKGATIRVLKLDFRPGGLFHYAMEFQPGHPIYGRFIYGLIDEPHRLEYISGFSDENGGLTRAPFPQLEGRFPLEIHNAVTVEEKNGATLVTGRSTPINATRAEIETFVGMFDSMRGGFDGTFDKLDTLLANR